MKAKQRSTRQRHGTRVMLRLKLRAVSTQRALVVCVVVYVQWGVGAWALLEMMVLRRKGRQQAKEKPNRKGT